MSSLKAKTKERITQPRTLLRLTLATLFVILTACTFQQDFPQSARNALEERLMDLPGGDPEFVINRAWLGVRPQSEPGFSMQTWCVEVDHSQTDESSPGLIWIVTREDEQSEWKAAMLATMSASWPYEACSER